MNKPFDPTKPVQTRAGGAAKILTTESKSIGYPIVALSEDNSGNELGRNYAADGCWCMGAKNDLDLINVPEKVRITGYINIYAYGPSRIHPSRESADSAAANTGNRIACFHLNQEVSEGEGL